MRTPLAATTDLGCAHDAFCACFLHFLGDFDRWLDCSNDDIEAALPLLTAPGEGEFVWHRVSTRVNRVANDDAQLILPITDEERAREQAMPPKKPAARNVAPIASEDGQGSLF